MFGAAEVLVVVELDADTRRNARLPAGEGGRQHRPSREGAGVLPILWELWLSSSGEACCQPGKSSSGISEADGDLRDLLAQDYQHTLSSPRRITYLGTCSRNAMPPSLSLILFSVFVAKLMGRKVSCWSPAWRTRGVVWGGFSRTWCLHPEPSPGGAVRAPNPALAPGRLLQSMEVLGSSSTP